MADFPYNTITRARSSQRPTDLHDGVHWGYAMESVMRGIEESSNRWIKGMTSRMEHDVKRA